MKTWNAFGAAVHAPLILLLKMLNLNSRSHLIAIEGARSIFGSVHACYLV